MKRSWGVLSGSASGALLFPLLALTLHVHAQSISITSQPQDQTVIQGANAVLSVGASGQSIVYQWYREGAALVDDTTHTLGAQSANLAILSAQVSDAGSYWVTVSNRHGMLTSSVAVLEVLVPPGISSQPQSRTVFVTSNTTFTVSATGSAPLAYQWRFNGGTLAGATNASLVLTNAQAPAVGSYQVIVTNRGGAATSEVATLAIVPLPAVLMGIDFGDGPFGLKVGPAAAGQEATDYWNHFGVNGPLANLKTARGNSTQAGVSGGGLNNWLLDSARSGDPMLDDYIFWSGSLTPTVVSDLPLGVYDFYVYSHDTASSLSSGGVDYGSRVSYEGFPLSRPPIWEEGRQFVAYRNVAITNAGQTVWVNIGRFLQPDAILCGLQIVRNTPWILQSPTNTLVAVDTDLVLQVSAESSPAPTCAWYFNGSALSDAGRVAGAHAATLVISNATLAETGDYWAVVSNANGSSTSAVATVRAGYAPTIVGPAANPTNVAGTTALFSTTVSGNEPMALQWWFNGSALSDDSRRAGSLTASLSVTNVGEGDAGAYTLVASNAFGVVTSTVATLTVLLPPSITVQPANQYVLVGGAARFAVTAKGTAPLSYQWLFNGVPLSENGRISGTGTRSLSVQAVQSADAGSYSMVVSNEWGAVFSSNAILGIATARYVNATNTTPVSPYLTWSGAATTIQAAIDASNVGDWIFVTNGVYATGGRVVAGSKANRVVMTNQVTVVAVNGPQVTTILGDVPPNHSYYGTRCVWLGSGATLDGFTVTRGGNYLGHYKNGLYDDVGGGIWCESARAVVRNCIISANSGCYYGGGVYSGTLINCLLAGNSAYAGTSGGQGGGAYVSQLINCTIVGNSAGLAGGMMHSSATNCINYYNSNGNYYPGYNTFTYSCTTPDPGGVGNITNEPAFVTLDGTNYRLQTNSPCMNAGATGLVDSSKDLDGLPRVVDAAVDMGAYEMQRAPWVVLGPTNQSVVLSSNAAFSAFAYGDEPLACQWQKDGVNLSDDGRIAGASTRALAISGVTTQDGGGYRLIVSNALGSATSSVATLTVLLPPTIVTHPSDQVAAVGAVASFSVLATGTAPLSYQWRREGTNLSAGGTVVGATTSILQLVGVSTNDATSYDVVVANAYGTVTSTVATLSLVPLAITNPPVSQAVPAGTNVTFLVGAAGFTPIGYQWRFNLTELPGKTNTSLALTNVQAMHAGSYDVVVTNAYSAVTSGVALLNVTPSSPTLVTQPVSRVVSVGQNAVFSVVAKGSEPMQCQWQKNGIDLPGATGFTLILTNVNSSFSGAYRAAVSNAVSSVITTNAMLVVSPVLLWGATNLDQLGRVSVAIPASATNVMAIAAGHCTSILPCFALRSEGSVSSWGISTALPTNVMDVVAISSVGPGPTKAENNLALRADGKVVHWYGTTTPALPAAVSNSYIVAVAAGGMHQLALREDGSVIAWGNNAYGQTNVPAAATNVIAIAAGEGHSLALRADGKVIGWGLNTSGQASALSNAANVVAISAGGSQSLALLADGSATGSIVTNTQQVTAYGLPPADATNLLAVSVGYMHSLGLRADRTVVGWGRTNYGVINIPPYASNVVALAAGGALSLALVNDPTAPPIPPRIARSPLGRTIVAGQSVVFNALAVGAPPLRYQWYRDGAPAAGQTNVWLALNNPLPADGGNYQLVAMNAFGSATSAVATVMVIIPPPQLRLATTQSNGFSFNFQSLPGVLYVVEWKSALGVGTWAELERRFGVGGLEIVTDVSGGGATRFYRVRALYAPPPKMSSTTWTTSTLNFDFPTVDGAVYVVEYKTNLMDSAWLELSRQTGTGAPVFVQDPAPAIGSRFYRVRVE